MSRPHVRFVTNATRTAVAHQRLGLSGGHDGMPRCKDDLGRGMRDRTVPIGDQGSGHVASGSRDQCRVLAAHRNGRAIRCFDDRGGSPMRGQTRFAGAMVVPERGADDDGGPPERDLTVQGLHLVAESRGQRHDRMPAEVRKSLQELVWFHVTMTYCERRRKWGMVAGGAT
jgi:hypothetical protein